MRKPTDRTQPNIDIAGIAIVLSALLLVMGALVTHDGPRAALQLGLGAALVAVFVVLRRNRAPSDPVASTPDRPRRTIGLAKIARRSVLA